MDARSLLRVVTQVPGRLLLLVLRAYQLVVSPMTPPTCRFYPSCSQYAVIAITRHGALKGSWLAVRRVLRCNPWNPGGVDDVPPARPRGERGHRHVHRHPDVAPSTH